MAIVNLKKEGVIGKLWRKWVLSTKQSDCETVKDEVRNTQISFIIFLLVLFTIVIVRPLQFIAVWASSTNVPFQIDFWLLACS